ncbi:PREDICTED: uncharacterized protein LOC100641347 [Amphimedon queenslandica]|uniref:Uncharacterized protein n=1 Tax=Amphimedon queenslandica TaxID=400682 RepID=A0A1X7TV35_AMPQE|nr:PREDICTED: uncharacterized protein LOC100641347 [Amphimedon queenslandica]|eukprot:XP_003389725.1 PREDICTED: uncharacterized protein LOC100641347 [Amphimedon queenslandica]
MATSSAPDYEGEVRELVQSLIAGCIQEISSEVPLETISIPTGPEINPEECMETIEELIKSWDLDGSWLHHTSYTGVRSVGGRAIHSFSVMFSQPSRRKPAPRATASVFFFFIVEGEGTETSTTVFYVVESQRVVLRPSTPFREVWLRKIISSKLEINSRITLK